MRIVGVVDLRGGRAVRAQGGSRARYQPVRTVAGLAIPPGDAVALARAYVDRLGVPEVYVADLDAILGGPPQEAWVAAIAGLGAPLWLDAGASSVEPARRAADLGAARIVVGLETLRSFNALAEICSGLGGDRVAFSLDLRSGEPIVARGIPEVAVEPAAIAARAVDAGVGSLIVLDLARVGTSTGVDVALVARIRKAAPDVVLLAGGGVRGPGDLNRLGDAGCDGVLVATALQEGRLGQSDVTAACRNQPSVRR